MKYLKNKSGGGLELALPTGNLYLSVGETVVVGDAVTQLPEVSPLITAGTLLMMNAPESEPVKTEPKASGKVGGKNA